MFLTIECMVWQKHSFDWISSRFCAILLFYCALCSDSMSQQTDAITFVYMSHIMWVYTLCHCVYIACPLPVSLNNTFLRMNKSSLIFFFNHPGMLTNIPCRERVTYSLTESYVSVEKWNAVSPVRNRFNNEKIPGKLYGCWETCLCVNIHFWPLKTVVWPFLCGQTIDFI